MVAGIGKAVLTKTKKGEKVRFELDISTTVRFEKESYHLTIIQDGQMVFLDREHVKELVKLFENQGFLD